MTENLFKKTKKNTTNNKSKQTRKKNYILNQFW